MILDLQTCAIVGDFMIKGLMASTWKEQLFVGWYKWRLGVGMVLKRNGRRLGLGVTSWDAKQTPKYYSCPEV